MVQEPNDNLYGKKLADPTPNYMVDYPEEEILTFEHSDGRQVKITGNIHDDKTGSSRLLVIGRGGQLICEFPFGRPKRCGGYVYCNLWEPETGRKAVIRDDIWLASQAKIIEYLQRFRDVKYADQEDDIDDANQRKKIKNMVQRGIDIALSGLEPPILKADVLPKEKYHTQRLFKVPSKKPEKKESEKNGPPKPRKQRKKSQFYPMIDDFGNEPFMDVRLNIRLCINTKSPIFPHKMKVNNTKEWLSCNAEQLGMIRMKVAEKCGQLFDGNIVKHCM